LDTSLKEVDKACLKKELKPFQNIQRLNQPKPNQKAATASFKLKTYVLLIGSPSQDRNVQRFHDLNETKLFD
jgi:hypothetical protein